MGKIDLSKIMVRKILDDGTVENSSISFYVPFKHFDDLRLVLYYSYKGKMNNLEYRSDLNSKIEEISLADFSIPEECYSIVIETLKKYNK
jgi:hypothetical protein